MTIRARLAAAANFFPAGSNFALSDTDAIALAASLDPAACRHGELLAAAVARIDALPAQPADTDALIAWAGEAKAARDALWEALEGETVEGLTIIRSR